MYEEWPAVVVVIAFFLKIYLICLTGKEIIQEKGQTNSIWTVTLCTPEPILWLHLKTQGMSGKTRRMNPSTTEVDRWYPDKSKSTGLDPWTTTTPHSKQPKTLLWVTQPMVCHSLKILQISKILKIAMPPLRRRRQSPRRKNPGWLIELVT